MKQKITNALSLLILGACTSISLPVGAAKTFNDVSFESDGCVISPDRKAVCTFTVTSNFRDRLVALANGVSIQDSTGNEYSAGAHFGDNKWSKVLVADAPYKLTISTENLATNANSIRSVIFHRIDVFSGTEQRNIAASHKQVVFSNPVMNPYVTDSSSQSSIATIPDSPSKTHSDWIVVGYWNYDGIDGQYLGEGLESINRSGTNAGQTWSTHLQLKAHDRLPARSRSLWPVKMNIAQKKICINVPNYPTYTAFIDFPDDKKDGVFTFQSCQ